MTMPVQSRFTAQEALQALSLAAEKLNAVSLKHKVQWLRQHRSDDPLDQMQSDTIADQYDAGRQIQEAIWPLLLLIPDPSGARDAASQAGAGTTAAPGGVSRLSATRMGRQF